MKPNTIAKKQPSTTCVTEIKTAKELQEIAKNHEETGILFHWDQCQGCQEMRSVYESECQANKLKFGTSPIALVGCEVGSNPECAKMWNDSKPAKMSEKDYGVPAWYLIPKNGTLKAPQSLIVSSSPEKKAELKSILLQLGQFANQLMDRGQNGQTSPQPALQANQQQPSSYSYPAQMYQNISNYVNEKARHIYQMKTNPNYQKLPDSILCVPGVDCDTQTFMQKTSQYLSM